MKSQTQRSLLLAFIVSVAGCGALGIACLISGRLGEFEARVLGTTAAVGAASILGLASAIPYERRRWVPVGHLGMIAVALALVLVLLAIWELVDLRSEEFFDFMGVACVAAVALPHVGLLSLARLRREYTWVRIATVAAIAVLAVQIDATVVADIDDEGWFRLMGIVAIAVVCGTIAVPIFHRMSIIRSHQEIRTVDLALSLTCPRCGKTQTLPVGRQRCGGCGLNIRIEIEEEQCPKCGYPLYRLTSAACPECGTPIADSAVNARDQTSVDLPLSH